MTEFGEFCCLKFISTKWKILILNYFGGEACPKNLLNGLRLMKELNFGLEKSGNFILPGKYQPCKCKEAL